MGDRGRDDRRRENAKIYLSEHPDIMEEIEQKVREHFAVDVSHKDETVTTEE